MSVAAADVIAWMVLGALLLAIAWIDIRSQRIPNRLNALLLVTGLVAAGLPSGPGLVAAVAGAVLGSVFLLAIAGAFRRLRGVEGLGLGDVKFLAGAGAWAGWQGIGPIVFIAASSALLWLGLQRAGGVAFDRARPIPFGPHLCLALVAVRVAQVF